MTRVVNLKTDQYDVFIGRGSKWGNPFTHIKDKLTLATHIVETREEAIESYREYILNNQELMDSLDELEGKTLGCYCMPSDGTFPVPFICHGQVLLDLISIKKLNNLFNKK